MRRTKKNSVEEPRCPRCSSSMVQREGKNGKFWGCSRYPACRGTKNMNGNGNNERRRETRSSTAVFAPIEQAPGSPEQEAIWAAMMRGKKHLVVEAVAGSGKTWTMIQACLRLPKTKKIAFVAFNRHIATEASGKLRASGCDNVFCCTYHSLGLRMVRHMHPKLNVSQYKVMDILDSFPVPPAMDERDWRHICGLARTLVGFAKNYLLDPKQATFEDEMERIADHHGLDMNHSGKHALQLVPRVLEECVARSVSVVDYDDMVWLPVAMRMNPPQSFDYLIVDEAQDTNKCQQELALRACPEGRIVIVGDRYQSIYGFRGADVTAIPSMTDRLGFTKRGVKSLPLTVTRRCPKSHVRLAQAVVPQIRAMDTAPDGLVHVCPEEAAVSIMQPGDMVVCRINRSLIPVAYELIRRGIKPVIRGRDIGKGLLDLITKLEKNAQWPSTTQCLDGLLLALRDHEVTEEARLAKLGDRASGRLALLRDQCDCLRELIAGSKDLVNLKATIETLFSDFDKEGHPKEAVVLGTVHRTKGLESERIFVLSPELIPHPMARQDWEYAQERNLAYVVVTRSKYSSTEPGTLVFCGLLPAIFAEYGQQVEAVDVMQHGVDEKEVACDA